MRFAIDDLAFGILLGGLSIFWLLKKYIFPLQVSPSLAFSRLNDLNYSTWKSRWVSHVKNLHIASLFCLMLAFIDPHLLFVKSPLSQKQSSPLHELPTKGIAIYLALDQSGSMAQPVKARDANGILRSIPKIELLKQVTKQFILDHPSDLLGLSTFARVPRILVPLTLDQEALLKQLEQLHVVTQPEQDGTAMGYAIFKTANLISATKHFTDDLRQEGRPPFTIKSSAIIVVTDGFQDPSRLDQGNRLRTLELDDAASYVKSQGIRLYVINIDPSLSSTEYAPQRRQLQAITSETGGKFYLVDDNQDLQKIYTDINRLEKGTISQEVQLQKSNSQNTYDRYSLYPFLIILGLSCLFIALMIHTLVLKPVP